MSQQALAGPGEHVQTMQPAAAALELLIEGAQALHECLSLTRLDGGENLTGGAWPDLVVEVAAA